jgi:hypothetical protein
MSRKTVWRRRVPPAVSVGVVAALAVVAAVAVLGLFIRPPRSPAALRPMLPPGSYPTAPVPAGEAAPAIAAEGWVNGPPPAVGADRKLVVLDIWATW